MCSSDLAHRQRRGRRGRGALRGDGYLGFDVRRSEREPAQPAGAVPGERGADGAMTGYAFPELLVDVVAWQKAGRRDDAHNLFDAHLPLMRYEQQQGVGLAVRKYTLMRRGILASDAQRKPGSGLSEKAKAEVEYLLARLAKHDPRATKLIAR